MKNVRSNLWFFGMIVLCSIAAGIVAYFESSSIIIIGYLTVGGLVSLVMWLDTLGGSVIAPPSPTRRIVNALYYLFAACTVSMVGTALLVGDYPIQVKPIVLSLLCIGILVSFTGFRRQMRHIKNPQGNVRDN